VAYQVLAEVQELVLVLDNEVQAACIRPDIPLVPLRGYLWLDQIFVLVKKLGAEILVN
jgi:hypothetical protein